MMKWLWFILLFFFVSENSPYAQDSTIVVSNIKMDGIEQVFCDRFKNLYVVTDEPALRQYDLKGKKLSEFNEVRYGKITIADISNPLNIMLYYGNFGIIQILDRNLTLQSEINLRSLGFITNTAIGLAADNNIWFYNLEKFRLIKIDPQGKTIRTSNELTGLIGKSAMTGQIWEQDNFLLMRAPEFGWMLFDDFGSYMQNLPLPDEDIQYISNNRIFFRQDEHIGVLDMNTMRTKSYPIPGFLDLESNIQFIHDCWIQSWPSGVKTYHLE